MRHKNSEDIKAISWQVRGGKLCVDLPELEWPDFLYGWVDGKVGRCLFELFMHMPIVDYDAKEFEKNVTYGDTLQFVFQFFPLFLHMLLKQLIGFLSHSVPAQHGKQ